MVVVQAPAPARLIEGGLPTEATVAQVLVAKYADPLPLYNATEFGGEYEIQQEADACSPNANETHLAHDEAVVDGNRRPPPQRVNKSDMLLRWVGENADDRDVGDT